MADTLENVLKCLEKSVSKSSKLRAAAPPKAPEGALQDRSKLQQFALFDSLVYGTVIVDKQGLVVAANIAARSLFQYRHEDITGMPVTGLLAAGDIEAFQHNLGRSVELLKTPARHISMEIEGLRKDTTRVPLELHMKSAYFGSSELTSCTFRDLSSRRTTEEAIRRKEEKLQLALQGKELWIWELDCSLQQISFEIQSPSSIGMTKNDVKMDFEDWLDLMHPQDKTAVSSGWLTLMSGDSDSFEFEFRVKRLNGNWDWIYSCGHVIKWGAEGQPLLISGLNLNISERKQTEASLQDKQHALLETERRLRLAQEASGVASWEYDLKLSRLSYFSENLPSLYGLDSSEPVVSFQSWLKIVHHEDRQRLLDAIEKTKTSSDGRLLLEFRVIWPDESIHWLTFHALLIHDQHNNPIKLSGTTFDITDRITALAELRESEDRFRSAFNQSAIPMLLVSKDDGVFRVNQAMCELSEYDENALLNMHLPDLVCPSERRSVQKFMHRVLHGDDDKLSINVRILTKASATKWIAASVVSIRDKAGVFRYAVVQVKDITEEHVLSSRLVHEATHDSLTGLVNRREFENRLVIALRESEQNDTESALAYLDLDQFKVINDTCGHAAGDELLQQLSKLISGKLRKDDVVARLGGDEFGVFMSGCDLQRAKLVIDKLHEVVGNFRFVWDDKTFNVTMSSGLVTISAGSRDIIEVLKKADAACYAAKDAGRNRSQVYHPQDEGLSRRSGEMQWVSRINHALEDNRFQLYCQPIAAVNNNNSGRLYYEVLLRLQEKNGDLVAPGAFLPAAERYGLSGRLDKWVIMETLRWLQAHPGHVQALELCCINLSGHSLGDENVLAFVEEQLLQNQVPADKICFEITETAAIANIGKASNFIKSLKNRGALFALDDFGSGLSSFAYLKSLDVDILKIDGTFVREIVTDPVDLAMVRSINEIGKVLGKRTTAEFVENDEILEILRKIGVDRAQGYGISRPIPLESLA